MKKDTMIGMIRLNTGIIVAAAALMALILAPVAQAATAVYDPAGVTASSELAGTNRTALQTINGSGLAFAVPATINTIADLPNHNEIPDPSTGGMWLTDNTTGISAPGAGSGHVGWIVFDLGVLPPIVNRIYVWNYAEENPGQSADFYTTRGANDVTIYADNSPISPTITGVNGTITNNGGTTVETTSFAQEHPNSAATPSAYNAAPEEIIIPAVTDRYIEFAITTNHGSADFVGLSEVRFGFVPEPASLGLLATGGALVLLRRRRA